MRTHELHRAVIILQRSIHRWFNLRSMELTSLVDLIIDAHALDLIDFTGNLKTK
jgi:hypothetical protein